MRISEEVKESILQVSKLVFGDDVSIYLFGSRIDDSKRGGDIDLYVKSEELIANKFKKKIDFLVELENRIGEQKVDLIINNDSNRLIEEIALSEGIKL